MPRRSALPGDCMLARSLEVLGEWWTFLIIRDAFFGIRHFEAFQASLGIARNVLSARLSKLVETGILSRAPDRQDGRRIEYRLTEKGRALLPIIVAIAQWGAAWMRCEDEVPPYRFIERDGGAVIPPIAVRSAAGAVLGPRDIAIEMRAEGDGIRNIDPDLEEKAA